MIRRPRAAHDKGELMTFSRRDRAIKAETGPMPCKDQPCTFEPGEGGKLPAPPPSVPYLTRSAALALKAVPRDWILRTTRPRRRAVTGHAVKPPSPARAPGGGETTPIPPAPGSTLIPANVTAAMAMNPIRELTPHPRQAATTNSGLVQVPGLLPTTSKTCLEEPWRDHGRASDSTRTRLKLATGLQHLRGASRTDAAGPQMLVVAKAPPPRSNGILGRLHRRGLQDGAAVAGLGQGVVPPCGGRRTPLKLRESFPRLGRGAACPPIARWTGNPTARARQPHGHRPPGLRDRAPGPVAGMAGRGRLHRRRRLDPRGGIFQGHPRDGFAAGGLRQG